MDLTRVLRDLLPADVGVAACPVTDTPLPLTRVEASAVADAVPARRHEFALGRTLAHRALRDLGVPVDDLPVGLDRAPSWPAGVVGALTHGGGWVAVAVGSADRWAGIGIDVEPDLPLGDDAGAALTAAEREAGRDVVLFSAKEAAFKAWAPATGRWLGFRDVTASVTGDRFVVAAGGEQVAGRWTTSAGLVVTAAVLDRAGWDRTVRPGH